MPTCGCRRAGRSACCRQGRSLAARTIPNIRYSGSGYAGTREARRDWVEFLRDLEIAYYDTMVAHLRGPLQYPGLIFGTIMANSPATVQSRLDVIDSHAYWQHPDFPGTPWDSVNWTVQNISMVNTLDNTLSGIARQRIKGKPFVCTEYQHPSPNYYGAEGPLLLAAYAGLQDWDGLWLFDYGQGNPVVTMGYVRGFFEIGQHPTKMANLLAAANLFRRGDVRPAQQEWTMALTPTRELDLLLNTYRMGDLQLEPTRAARKTGVHKSRQHQRGDESPGSDDGAGGADGERGEQRHGGIEVGHNGCQQGAGDDQHGADQGAGGVRG